MPAVSSGRIVKAKRGKKPPGQQHQKNHRWESFSSRMAKLHALDPLRRVRRHDLDEATAGDVAATTSFFRNGLERWADLNLSRIYTAFRRTVTPLSESLAQILHHEARIMDVLAGAIEEAQALDDEREALEPLLDLLTAFAHDLGTRFVARGYDARAFVLLVNVARHNSGAGMARARAARAALQTAQKTQTQQNHVLDAAVIEWTFAALAFLFKYLARLLVADLRPTYDILVPLLGGMKEKEGKGRDEEEGKRRDEEKEAETEKTDEEIEEVEMDEIDEMEEIEADADVDAAAEAEQTQESPPDKGPQLPARVPGHIARFAAEAMSFLVKKAAAPSHRETALRQIVAHARDGLLRMTATAPERFTQLHAQGLMTLFAEAIKGAGTSLHSSGAELFVVLVQAIPAAERAAAQASDTQTTPWSDVCCGVLTSVVNHASAAALRPVVDALVAEGVAARAAAAAANDPWQLSVYVRLAGVLAGVKRGDKLDDDDETEESREGRATAWTTVVGFVVETLEAMTAGRRETRQWPAGPGWAVWRRVVVSTAIVWSQAPEGVLVPWTDRLATQALGREPLARWFVAFCAYVVELAPARFRALLQRPFERFVAGHWAEEGNEAVLCVVVPVMAGAGAFEGGGAFGRSAPGQTAPGFTLPQSWQDQIVARFEQLEATPFPEGGAYGPCGPEAAEWRARGLPQLAARLALIEAAGAHPATRVRLAELLRRKLRLALRPTAPRQPTNAETAFVVTQGFGAYLRLTAALGGQPDVGLRPLLRAAAPRFARRPAFLEGLVRMGAAAAAVPEDEDTDADTDEDKTDDVADSDDPLVTALVANLAAPSHRLRLVSLQLLRQTIPDSDAADAADSATTTNATVVDTMLQIEQMPCTPHNARAMAVHLRKLGLAYGHVAAGAWLQTAVPAFLFGMLSVPLAPVWDDAVAALQQVAQTSVGEEAVAQRALAWLEGGAVNCGSGGGGLRRTGSGRMGGSRNVATDFECTHWSRLQTAAADTEAMLADPAARLREDIAAGQEAVELLMGAERGKALRVLAAMPAMAEKRSRRLVPHLLSWGGEEGVEEEEEEGEDDDGEDEEGVDDDKDDGKDDGTNEDNILVHTPVHTRLFDNLSGWSFADKKALVGVFAQFANGRALFQSAQVYAALLRLAGNGDAAVQRLALRALLSWRQPALAKHRDSLERLVADGTSGSSTGFKTELTLLLQPAADGVDDGRRIDAADRPVLLPVLLRLLYGRAIAKKGAASGRQGLHATRLFVLRSLDSEALGGFLGIALGRLQHVRVLPPARWPADLLPARKQVGVLTMLEALLGALGPHAAAHMPALVHATLYCLVSACRGLAPDGHRAVDTPTSLWRVAKTAGLRCLCALFRVDAAAFDWTPYRRLIVDEVLGPVLDRLPQETTQGVSWTWRLLGVWAEQPRWAAVFWGADPRIVPQVLAALALDRSKDAVRLYALELVRTLAADDARAAVLLPHLDLALRQLDHVLRASGAAESGRALLEAGVDTVVALAPLATASAQVGSLVAMAAWLLGQPSRRVRPRVKSVLLAILERFLLLDGSVADAALRARVLATLATLFSFFHDRDNRAALCRVLAVLAAATPDAAERTRLAAVADCCADLNAWEAGRMDAPDYDRRLAAFGAVARADGGWTLDQWGPLLHNLLFFLRRDDEFGVLASNAADGLCRFVADSARAGQPRDEAHAQLLQAVVLPALYGGARDPAETVRRQVVRVFGCAVRALRAWPPLAGVAVLVPADEEETGERERGMAGTTTMDDVTTADDDRASRAFFTHILGPAHAKQMQAMQVLEGVSVRHALGSRVVSQFFVPLLEQLIFGREDGVDDHGLGAQATTTVGTLMRSLAWPQYRAVLRRFLGYVAAKPAMQKQVVRLLDRVVEALLVEVDVRNATTTTTTPSPTALGTSLPPIDRLADEILALLPPLLQHLHDKDEETVSARVPVGVVIVKLLRVLPPAAREQRLASVLTDICHILRSRAWDAREMARDTLARIVAVLGPDSFGFVLQELRGALTRGYQLHVLSYTLHSLLLAVLPGLAPGALDYCAESAMAVVLDDVFGVAGSEKDADAYTSQMKEVRSRKSADSLELLARTTSLARLQGLVRPLRALLQERIDLAMARKIDTLLARIAAGLVHNPAAGAPDTLVFCYEVVQDVYAAPADTAAPPKPDPRTKKFLVQRSRRNNVGGRQASRFTHKLVRFALDVLRAVLRRFDALRTAQHLAGLVPLLGDAVVDGVEEVQTAALKLLVVVARVPFPPDTAAAAACTGLFRVATRAAFEAVRTASSTAGDHAQAALQLVAAVLRDRAADVPVRPAAVDGLLARLRDDLTAPLLRHVTFHVLRAILGRRIETAAVYDTLDYVGTIMVTNADRDTRDLARGAFLQFVREYPQRRARWQAQIAFVVANLQYDRESGRLSVLEMAHLLLLKADTHADYLQQLVAACFPPLVVCLANDDSTRCRAAAAALLRLLLRRAAPDARRRFLATFRTWLAADADAKPAVVRLGLEAWGLAFGAWDDNDDDNNAAPSPDAVQDARTVLARIVVLLGDDDSTADHGDAAQTTAALETVQTLLTKAPALALSADTATLWRRIEHSLWHPSGTVRLAAMRLVGLYLADFVRGADGTVAGRHGLTLTDGGVAHLVLGCLSVLSRRDGLGVDEAEADEAAGMLVHLGRHLREEAEETEEETEEKSAEEEDDDDADDDEIEDAEDEEDEKEQADKAPVDRPGLDRRYVILRLARILRRETPAVAAALVPKAAAMAVLAAYCQQKGVLSATAARAVLRPLRNLTDATIAAPTSADPVFGTRYDALRERAIALMDVLQARLGSAVYTRLLLAVGAAARGRRQQRATKRKVEAVTAPEKHGQDKRKRLEKKKERRKVRGQEHRSHRRGV